VAVPADLTSLAAEDFCYLTTIGRVTGRAHTIEIWFAVWVKNLCLNPRVAVLIDQEHFDGRARIVESPEEDALARRLLVEKYERSPGSLTNWRHTALPVAVDLIA
jgi:hypothetical protein